MNIAFDGHFITGNRSGVGNYSYYLMQELLKCTAHTYYIIFNSLRRHRPDIPFLKQKNVKILYTPIPNSFPTDIYSPAAWARYTLFFPAYFKAHGIELFHGFNCILPPKIGSVKYVTTYHDMSMVTLDGIAGIKKNNSQLARLKKWAQRADKIICVSQNSLYDTEQFIPDSKGKTAVVHNGFDTAIHSPAAVKNPDSRFILFVGTVEERKNIDCCIEAFRKMKQTGKFPEMLLYIAGNDSTPYALVIKEKIKQLNLTDSVHFLGYTDTSQLAWLYSHAQAFFFPTFYEGFGFPVLEAMKYRCPVICSNNSSLPEIAGDAALTADPSDSDMFCSHLIQICTDVSLRNELIKKGIEQTGKFSWEKNARTVLEIYDSLR